MSETTALLLSLLLSAQLSAPLQAAPQTTKLTRTEKSPAALPRGKSVSFYLSRGGRLLETGDYLQAIIYLDAALSAPRKGVKPAIIQLAEVLRRSADLYQQARVLRENGQAELAVDKYNEIRRINPTDPKPLEFIIEVYDLLSEAAEKRQDYAEAARLYENWLHYAPANDFPRKGMITNLKAAAAAAEQRGDRDGALLFYRKLAGLAPNDLSHLNKVKAIEKEQVIESALAQFNREDLDSAIRALSGALSLYPNEPRLAEPLRQARGRQARLQADALMASHRYHEALSAYKKTLQFLPEERAAINRLIAEIELRTGAGYQSNDTVRALGRITGPAKIRIAGNSVTAIEGKDFISLRIGGKGLPTRPYDVKINRTDGDAQIKIVERPNRANDFALILQLLPKDENVVGFDIDWHLNTAGTVVWRGRVSGAATIRLQGPFIDQTGNVRQVSTNFDPLPHESFELVVTKVQGGSGVATQIVERPTAANDYAATIAVSGAGQDEEIELKFDWKISEK